MLAPIGSLESFAEGGGATAARAAGSFGIAQMLSSVCNPGLEAVAEATGPKGKGSGPKGKGGGSGGPGGNGTDHLRIFQLYVRGDAAWCDEWVRRAEEHGYSAFCLTVDTAAYSRRERDLAKRFVKAWRRDASGLEWQPRLNWDDVKRYKDTHGLPLILKGIATGEDAEIACQHGVDWVYVSNHGGRQLDHGRGGLEVLPEVVAAVNGRAKVLYDGAIMRGTDIVKAIASGADMVGIGRLGVIGLAAAGEAGLVRVLEILEDEVKIALALLGVRGFEELDASYLHPAQPVSEPHTLSAFPLLEPHEEGKGY
jgi:glycolate oxidase